MRTIGRAALAVLAWTMAAAAPQDQKGLEIIWVDVEGGAATLIVTPAGESILVDTGFPGARDAERIHRAATKAGLKRIDHLITTHWHDDHFGGLAALAERIPIGRFYDHGSPEEVRDGKAELKQAYLKLTQGKAQLLAPGDAIPLAGPGIRLRILSANALTPGEEPGAPQAKRCDEHPAIPDDTSDNARSVGFLFSLGGFDFLDMGDLTWNVEHKLVCPKNLIGKVDLYQVTHHGTDNSNNPALVKAVEPTVAVMNNGPRKGGKAKVYQILKGTPSIKDVFQLHRNVDTAPADNAPPEFTANDDADCKGEPVRLTADAAGKSFSVEIPGKGTKRTYASK